MITAYCPRCHYDVSALGSPGVCPECGRDFDSGSVLRVLPPASWRVWVPGVCGAAVLLALNCALGVRLIAEWRIGVLGGVVALAGFLPGYTRNLRLVAGVVAAVTVLALGMAVFVGLVAASIGDDGRWFWTLGILGLGVVAWAAIGAASGWLLRWWFQEEPPQQPTSACKG